MTPQLFELVIDNPNVDEVFAISLVKDPAIESDFVFFGKQKEVLKFATVSNEQRLVLGPILIPNKNILRLDSDNNPYYVFFSPETIKQLSEMYLEKKYNSSVTLEHATPINDISLVESWIVESAEKDKSKLYGINVPAGTWMGTMKINNDEIWNEFVKTGAVQGFSIEGMFGHKLVSQAKVQDISISDLEEQEAAEMLASMRTLIKKDKRYNKGQTLVHELYDDYSEAVVKAAKRGIRLNNENGGKCASAVSLIRAAQLAKRSKLSVDTIKRMHSYLNKTEPFYKMSNTKDCGYVSYMMWGGVEGHKWAKEKLTSLGIIKADAQPSIPNSTYAGEPSKKIISPSTISEKPKLKQKWSDVFASIK